MANLQQIMQRAQALRQETALDSISPERAGGIMYDTLSYINQMQLQDANPILLSKIYSSVEAMEADTAPVSDITGKALRPGQVVVIVTSSTSSQDYGVVYRYNGTVDGASSWTAVGKIGSSPYLEGYLYAGIATPATDPQTANITQRVFYRAVEPGTYANFGGIVVNSGEVVNLKFDGSSWSKEVTGEASAASVTELGQDVREYTREETSELNKSVFGIVLNDIFGFTNTWGSPTQLFVAPIDGKYTITVKSTDFTVLSPESQEYLMIDNTVVSLGYLTAETISQLTDGYTISNIQLSQGDILEWRDRLSGNASVIIKEENTGLVYEVGLSNDKDTQPLPGSERLVKSGGVFLEEVKLNDKIATNRKGIAFDTHVYELTNNQTYIANLSSSLEIHKIYTLRLSTDRPLTRLAIVNPTSGELILDISNISILKDYEITYYDATATSTLQLFQTNSDGAKCNLSLSIGSIGQESISSIQEEIDNTKSNIIRLKDSIPVKDTIILSDDAFLMSIGDHALVSDYSFQNGKVYLITIQCEDTIVCDEFTLYGNLQDRKTVSGKLNGKEIIFTPFTTSTGLKYYLKNPTTNNFYTSIKVVELSNYVNTKWSLVQHREFAGGSTSATQDISLLYPTPFITKGLKYKVIIFFGNGAKSFNWGYLNLTTIPRVSPESTTQIAIPPQSNTTYVEVEFTAPHDVFRVWATFNFSGTLSSAPAGDAYLLKVGTTEYSVIEEDNLKNTSNYTGFLISYSSDALTPHSGTKLNLGYGTDGLHFRKLQVPYIHDFYQEYGDELNNDLCIFKKGEYFYLTGSSQNVPVGATDVPVHILKSKNLKDWTLHATLQFPVSSFPVDEGNRVMAIWAPEILELNGSYYLSFAVGEAENPYVEKGYLADLNSDLNSYSNIRSYTINMNEFDYTYDNTFLYDEERGKYLGYYHDGTVYETESLNDSNEGEWTAIGMLPLQENGYHYMEGGTIIKYKGWYYIYGDATLTNGGSPVTQNLACFRTKDFRKYEVCFEQFDTKIRHPKIILVDAIDSAIATQLYLDSLI